MSCMLKKEILGDDMLHTKLDMYLITMVSLKKKLVPYWMEKTYKYLCGKVSIMEKENRGLKYSTPQKTMSIS